MSIITTDDLLERILCAVRERVAHAEQKHPCEMTFHERWRVSHKELFEALEALSADDHDGAVQEYIDEIAGSIRNIKQLVRLTGARIA